MFKHRLKFLYYKRLCSEEHSNNILVEHRKTFETFCFVRVRRLAMSYKDKMLKLTLLFPFLEECHLFNSFCQRLQQWGGISGKTSVLTGRNNEITFGL